MCVWCVCVCVCACVCECVCLCVLFLSECAAKRAGAGCQLPRPHRTGVPDGVHHPGQLLSLREARTCTAPLCMYLSMCVTLGGWSLKVTNSRYGYSGEETTYYSPLVRD